MAKLELTGMWPVNGVMQDAGFVFEASEKEATLWIQLGRARVSGVGELAEAGDGDEPTATEPRGRHARPGYNRRDMRARG